MSSAPRAPENQPFENNRRRAFRVPSPLYSPPAGKAPVDPYRQPIEVQLDFGEEQINGLLLDLSIRGLGALLRQPLELDNGERPLRVNFRLPGHPTRFDIPAAALHGRLAPGGYLVGIEFRESDPLRATRLESALAAYLSERQRRDLSRRAI